MEFHEIRASSNVKTLRKTNLFLKAVNRNKNPQRHANLPYRTLEKELMCIKTSNRKRWPKHLRHIMNAFQTKIVYNWWSNFLPKKNHEDSYLDPIWKDHQTPNIEVSDKSQGFWRRGWFQVPSCKGPPKTRRWIYVRGCVYSQQVPYETTGEIFFRQVYWVLYLILETFKTQRPWFFVSSCYYPNMLHQWDWNISNLPTFTSNMYGKCSSKYSRYHKSTVSQM